MDIEQTGELIDDTPDGDHQPGQLIVPGESWPTNIFILPQDNRPFFPGQAMPLVLDTTAWAPTIEAMREAQQDVIGLVATHKDLGSRPPSQATKADLYHMGTLCRIHRVQQVDGTIQVLLEGVRRFQIDNWLNPTNPLHAAVSYPPRTTRADAQSPEAKAYAVAIINMIKELIPLNPLYGEELKGFLNRFNPNEASLLADFAAALTSASKSDLQKVLETTTLLPRLEQVVELLHKELEIAKAQMDIREHVEGEIQGHQREAFLRQQLKFIQQELGLSKDDKTNDLDTFAERLEGVDVPELALNRVNDERQKLGLLEPGSPEYGVVAQLPRLAHQLALESGQRRHQRSGGRRENSRSTPRRAHRRKGTDCRVSRHWANEGRRRWFHHLLERTARGGQDIPRQGPLRMRSAGSSTASRWAACATRLKSRVTAAPTSAPCQESWRRP